MTRPSYISLSRTGELERRASRLMEILDECVLCPHECRVNRAAGETGECEAPAELVVSSCFPHFGEEAPLVGWNGSGTVFLSHCSLKCVFCQNNTISHYGSGEPYDVAHLTEALLNLQMLGCHNINFVTPTHYIPHIVSAVAAAAERGLCVPLVYNTSGYDRVDTLKMLDGIFDIYMPDTKFASSETAARYTRAGNYAECLYAALTEMHRQTGDLSINDRGIAERGMIIRHLVMPGGIAGTSEIMRFIAEKLSRNAYVNIMDQYHPSGYAYRYPELNSHITTEEMQRAVAAAREAGLHRGFL